MRHDEFSRADDARDRGLAADDLFIPVFVLDGTKSDGTGSFAAGVARKISTCCYTTPTMPAAGDPAMALFPVVPQESKSLDAAGRMASEGWCRAPCAREGTLSGPRDRHRRRLDPYTSQARMGLIDDAGYVQNEATVAALVKQALVTPRRASTSFAPSDMRMAHRAVRAASTVRVVSSRASSRIRPSTHRRSTGRSGTPWTVDQRDGRITAGNEAMERLVRETILESKKPSAEGLA